MAHLIIIIRYPCNDTLYIVIIMVLIYTLSIYTFLAPLCHLAAELFKCRLVRRRRRRRRCRRRRRRRQL